MFKGQAFDTFQLMIAAVIAVAILGILLGIIGNITGNVTQEPVEVAKKLVSQALDSPCVPMSSDPVNFNENDGWIQSAFSEYTGYRASSVITDCSNLPKKIDPDTGYESKTETKLFSCGRDPTVEGNPLSGTELSSASSDFQGKMTVMCKGENCAITVYTSTKSPIALKKLQDLVGC